MKISIRKNWIRDDSQPDECDCCIKEKFCNFGFIKIGNMRFQIWLCENCLEKLKRMLKVQED